MGLNLRDRLADAKLKKLAAGSTPGRRTLTALPRELHDSQSLVGVRLSPSTTPAATP
jgi:signal transduction histidine kinase